MIGAAMLWLVERDLCPCALSGRLGLPVALRAPFFRLCGVLDRFLW